MPRNISSDRFAEAAFDEQEYDALLRDVAQIIDARSIAAGWYYNDGTSSMLVDNGYWPAEEVARYSAEFAPTDVWAQAQRANWQPGKVTDLADLVSDREYERSTLWQQFFRELGDDTWRAVCIGTDNEAGVGGIAFHRGKGQAGFHEAALQFLDRHAAPLSRVHALRGRLAALEKAAVTSTRALDVIGRAVFVVTRSAKIIHANVAAEELLEQGDLRNCRGHLAASPASADIRLKLAISDAATKPTHDATAVRLASRDGSAMSLSIVPAFAVRRQPQVVVIADAKPVADATLETRLRVLFGLSGGEARIAIMLASGADPARIAESRSASIGTVRLQIKSIASKMSCRRQTDIVRVVANLPPIAPVRE